jgi:hypothetical protein
MQHGTISLWRLAAYVASAAQTASVQRRFYRLFQFVRLTQNWTDTVMKPSNTVILSFSFPKILGTPNPRCYFGET